MARPSIAGETGGAGQPAAESEKFPLPEPAAGCHLGRGSASFPNLPSLWKRRRKLCAEKIASPSILRLSLKNPTKPAFEKGRNEKWALTKGICFSWGLYVQEKSLFLPSPIFFFLVLSFYVVITLLLKIKSNGLHTKTASICVSFLCVTEMGSSDINWKFSESCGFIFLIHSLP